jgi:hypothetical protein
MNLTDVPSMSFSGYLAVFFLNNKKGWQKKKKKKKKTKKPLNSRPRKGRRKERPTYAQKVEVHPPVRGVVEGDGVQDIYIAGDRKRLTVVLIGEAERILRRYQGGSLGGAGRNRHTERVRGAVAGLAGKRRSGAVDGVEQRHRARMGRVGHGQGELCVVRRGVMILDAVS